jgi:hypothetical protein
LKRSARRGDPTRRLSGDLACAGCAIAPSA